MAAVLAAYTLMSDGTPHHTFKVRPCPLDRP